MVDKRIVKLGREEVVNAIKGTEWVMYQRGVWNSYRKCKTNEVAEIVMDINACGYGADVYQGDDGMLYVSVPVASDMW